MSSAFYPKPSPDRNRVQSASALTRLAVAAELAGGCPPAADDESNLGVSLTLYDLLPREDRPANDVLLGRFLEYTEGKRLRLYPAQETAILELFEDKNVILNTPTGSGKSLVAAAVHFKALAQGKRVADSCQFYLQFGSQETRNYCVQKGYLYIFQRAGAHVIEPSCGACINAGPGVSTRADQVVISAQNRNFPGRSGPGQMYLASPLTVAASAVAGYIVEYQPAEERELIGAA